MSVMLRVRPLACGGLFLVVLAFMLGGCPSAGTPSADANDPNDSNGSAVAATYVVVETNHDEIQIVDGVATLTAQIAGVSAEKWSEYTFEWSYSAQATAGVFYKGWVVTSTVYGELEALDSTQAELHAGQGEGLVSVKCGVSPIDPNVTPALTTSSAFITVTVRHQGQDLPLRIVTRYSETPGKLWATVTAEATWSAEPYEYFWVTLHSPYGVEGENSYYRDGKPWSTVMGEPDSPNSQYPGMAGVAIETWTWSVDSSDDDADVQLEQLVTAKVGEFENTFAGCSVTVSKKAD